MLPMTQGVALFWVTWVKVRGKNHFHAVSQKSFDLGKWKFTHACAWVKGQCYRGTLNITSVV